VNGTIVQVCNSKDINNCICWTFETQICKSKLTFYLSKGRNLQVKSETKTRRTQQRQTRTKRKSHKLKHQRLEEVKLEVYLTKITCRFMLFVLFRIRMSQFCFLVGNSSGELTFSFMSSGASQNSAPAVHGAPAATAPQESPAPTAPRTPNSSHTRSFAPATPRNGNVRWDYRSPGKFKFLIMNWDKLAWNKSFATFKYKICTVK